MVIGIDASQANKQQRTGTEWYAFHIITTWIQTNSFKNSTVLLYVREPLREDFPKLPENWHVRVLRWPPKILWTHLRLSFELFIHRVNLLFVLSHTVPLYSPHHTFTTIHDVGFEHEAHVYGTSSVVHLQHTMIRGIISMLVRAATLGKYGANELDYQRFSVRLALKKASHIFTVSEFTKSEILKFFTTNKPITVAYNGIDHQEFNPERISQQTIYQAKKRYGLQRYILSIGRIEKKKNSLQLIKAYHSYITHHQDNSLSLVFIGPEGYGAEEVRSYIKRHSLSSRIVMPGWVPQSDLSALLAGSEAFMFLSQYEGFGVPLIQSMAIGIPVVANNLEVFKEIGDAIPFYCNAHDPKSVEKQLHIAISSDDTIIDRLNRGKNIARTYTWSRTSETIERILNQTLLISP